MRSVIASYSIKQMSNSFLHIYNKIIYKTKSVVFYTDDDIICKDTSVRRVERIGYKKIKVDFITYQEMVEELLEAHTNKMLKDINLTKVIIFNDDTKKRTT